jgi:proteic killer suppression protein
MIQGFACKRTQRLFDAASCPAQWRSIKDVAERKLDMIDAAIMLSDLRAPPGNRLECLKGDRAGQHSIRVNDKWRVCFVWTDRGPDRVEITDYHY